MKTIAQICLSPLTWGLFAASALAIPVSAHPEASSNMVPVPGPAGPKLLGATAVLGKTVPKPIGKSNSSVEPKSDEKKLTPKELRDLIQAFKLRSASLSAEEAATQWISLVDDFFALAPNSVASISRVGVGLNEVFQVIPPPATWPAIENVAEARKPRQSKSLPDLTLLLIAHTLNQKADEAQLDLKALRPLLPVGRRMEANGVKDLEAALAANSAHPEQMPSDPAPAADGIATLPDLVTLIGPAAAENRIRQHLLTSKDQLVIPVGDETQRLARRLARGLMPQLKGPQWGLAQSVDSLDLFEAMRSRFKGQADPSASLYQGARLYYLLGLIAVHRSAEAVNLATAMARDGNLQAITPEVLTDMDKAGHTAALNQFLSALLTKNPDLPYWGTYIAVAARSGQTGPMLTLVRQMTARKNLPPARVIAIRSSLADALLAADHVDEAVVVLRQLLATPKTALKNTHVEFGEESDGQSSEEIDKDKLAHTLANVGFVAGRPNLTAEGIAFLKAHKKPEESYMGESLPAFLRKLGHDNEAETELIGDLRNLAKAPAEDPSPMMFTGMTSSPLVELAGIYHRRGMQSDVLNLVETAPWWPAEDLALVLTARDSTGIPLGHMVAVALASTGRKDEAIKIETAVLWSDNNFDPAYQLLIQLQGQECIPTLDALFAYDRFEERPLIWKAYTLFKGGELADAEKTARAAVAIDPSDGEMGKGYRMRVYSVLADIVAARGDATQANTLRGAVRAIRAAEQADDIYEAGLLSRGIKAYSEALSYFSDAYCIQSRLAVQLAAVGRYDEAETHYRRAFELMPDSFGRMESHCFGCEGAFAGGRAETIAESVFRRLLFEQPKKPQLHYLMGYLREEEDRFGDARTNYSKAVQLDPDYINAWAKLLGTAKHLYMPPAQRDAAALNLVRLDPAFNHLPADFSEVADLKGLWFAVEAAAKHTTPPQPDKFMPLHSTLGNTQVAMKKSMMEVYGMSEDDYLTLMSMYSGNGTRRISPAGAISQQNVLSNVMKIGQAIQTQSMMKSLGLPG